MYINKGVLVQKLQDNCNKFTNLRHADTTNLKKVRDGYEKGKCIQMAGYQEWLKFVIWGIQEFWPRNIIRVLNFIFYLDNFAHPPFWGMGKVIQVLI
ncbi:hypothetical protein CQ058_27440 [Bacillus sp. MYb56]|nr:hypothetical protein [Bacillus mycoides]PRD07089.1 hypothetical protein CQ058_27440 [Bacillus sp. MYb56]